MSSADKNLSDQSTNLDGNDLSLAIIVSDWNKEITHALYEGALKTLIDSGVDKTNIYTYHVPGTFELPSASKMVIKSKKIDAVIALGVVIKGETEHDVYINTAVANGLMQLSLLSDIPCIFGVLTTNDKQQAIDRSGGKYGNKGIESAATAITMAKLKKNMANNDGQKIGF